MKRKFAVIFILCISLLGGGCKTTLNKTSRVLNGAATLYSQEIKTLHAQGLLDQPTFLRLSEKAAAIEARTRSLTVRIDNLAEIKKGDASALTGAIAAIVREIQEALADPAIAGLTEHSRAIKTLRYLSASLDAVSLALSLLYPDATTSASTRGLARPIRARDVIVNLPEKPKGL